MTLGLSPLLTLGISNGKPPLKNLPPPAPKNCRNMARQSSTWRHFVCVYFKATWTNVGQQLNHRLYVKNQDNWIKQVQIGHGFWGMQCMQYVGTIHFLWKVPKTDDYSSMVFTVIHLVRKLASEICVKMQKARGMGRTKAKEGWEMENISKVRIVGKTNIKISMQKCKS